MTSQTASGKDRVVIFDTTLRDGEQSPGATMTDKHRSFVWSGLKPRSIFGRFGA